MPTDHFAATPVRLSAPVATITLHQWGAFLAFLRDRGERTADLPAGSQGIDIVAVQRWPLASLTALFDYEPAVIAVVDEAQFRGWNLRVCGDQRDIVMMGVAPSCDDRAIGGGVMREVGPAMVAPARAVASC